MRPLWTLLSIAALTAFPMLANAEVIGGMNWADGVADYSANIQNYAGTLMSATTEFWVTGVPDADANGDGAVENDFVAGWRSSAPSEFITVYFNTALTNLLGDDLSIWLYNGPKASATGQVSTDGVDFTSIGSISGDGASSGPFRAEAFDFDGLFAGDVHYVKVLRAATGANTGMFFDAFGGTAVPEPGTVVLLSAAGLLVLIVYAKRKRKGNAS